MAIQIGSAVWLKNSKQAMVVEKIDGDQVTCVWIDSIGKPQREIYSIALLTDENPSAGFGTFGEFKFD